MDSFTVHTLFQGSRSISYSHITLGHTVQRGQVMASKKEEEQGIKPRSPDLPPGVKSVLHSKPVLTELFQRVSPRDTCWSRRGLKKETALVSKQLRHQALSPPCPALSLLPFASLLLSKMFSLHVGPEYPNRMTHCSENSVRRKLSSAIYGYDEEQPRCQLRTEQVVLSSKRGLTPDQETH